jgi:transposase
MAIVTYCKHCEKKIERRGNKPAVFCSIECKGSWQKTQKPVTKDWLYQKYIVEGLGTSKIAQLVNRHPKRVYEWIVDYGIPLRTREWSNEAGTQPFHSKEWIHEQYVVLSRSGSDIAQDFGVTERLIYFWLKKHGIARRTVSEARSVKHWGQSGEDNPMFGKTGDKNGNYKGGCTPERQGFYASKDWAIACCAVWKRDSATCQKCGTGNKKESTLHVHHIVNFSVKHLRADIDNLVLLCRKCHIFVHSKKNVERVFLMDYQDND